jgi:acetyl-CoA C-acetyltransferase
MSDAYIIDAARSPTGKKGGSLENVHAADLGAHVIKALVPLARQEKIAHIF